MGLLVPGQYGGVSVPRLLSTLLVQQSGLGVNLPVLANLYVIIESNFVLFFPSLPTPSPLLPPHPPHTNRHYCFKTAFGMRCIVNVMCILYHSVLLDPCLHQYVSTYIARREYLYRFVCVHWAYIFILWVCDYTHIWAVHVRSLHKCR